MREDKFNNWGQTDVNLRDAILQEEQQLPQMPADLNARLMQRMSAQQPRRHRRVWPWIAAACVAAILVVYLTPPKFWQGSADDTAQTMLAHGTVNVADAPSAPAADSVKRQEPVAPAVPAAQPKAKKPVRRSPVVVPVEDVRGQDPGSDLPGHCPLTSPLVAVAAPQPAAKMKVITERDIPITRPENYQHTPEEIALLKKQAAEAYLKWVELELEISRNNLEQAMQK